MCLDLSGLLYASLRPRAGVVGDPGAAAAVACALMASLAALAVGEDDIGLVLMEMDVPLE